MRAHILGLLAMVASTAFAIDFEGDHGIIVEPPRPALDVDIWTDRGERAVYYPGERIKLFFKANNDAYVVVYDVDTEGRVKLLFPSDPYRGGWVSGGTTEVLPPHGSDWDMRISGPTGIEYVVAVASTEPFMWDEYAEQLASGGVLEAITSDPQMGIERINQLIAPVYDGVPYYISDRTSFYVERRVPYPRYMCYDCHNPRHWDPYYSICPAFEIVIFSRYDDYYYRPPHNPWGRRPYYWYKRKLNREYPTVKYKNAGDGRDWWEGRTKRKWAYPPEEPDRDGRGAGDRNPRDDGRWKDITTPDRPSAPEIRVKAPPAERSGEREGGGARDGGSDRQGTRSPAPETRDKPAPQPERQIQTRPFYREREPAKSDEQKEKPRSRPQQSDSSDSRKKEK